MSSAEPSPSTRFAVHRELIAWANKFGMDNGRKWNSLPKSEKETYMRGLRQLERKYGVELTGNYNGKK